MASRIALCQDATTGQPIPMQASDQLVDPSGNPVSGNGRQRSRWVSGNQFRKGSTAPADVTIGATPTIPALRFSATNELASVFQFMPDDWDRTANVTIDLLWSLVDAETNAETLDVSMDYVMVAALTTGGGIAKASTGITASATVTTGNGLAVGDMYITTFTLAFGDATNPFAGATGIGLEVHLTNVTGVTRADLVAGLVHYQALY